MHQLLGYLLERRRWIPTLMVIILTSAVVKGLWDLSNQIHYELVGPFNVDTDVYLTLGRAMYNGLQLYVDIYEQKPPLILFLPTLSLWLTGEFWLLRVFQACIIASFACVPTIHAYFVTRTQARDLRILAMATAALFGICLALFTAARAGQYQTESFGAFAAMLFAIVIGTRNPLPRWRIVCAGLALAAAVGFKEPFLLSCLACSLIMRGTWKDLPRSFLLPLCIAAISGTVIMAAMGWLGPYLTIHLPEMFGARIHYIGSPWEKPFDVLQLFASLQANSIFLKFAVILLCAHAICPQVNTHHSRIATLAAAVGILLFECATDTFHLRHLLIGIVQPSQTVLHLQHVLFVAVPLLLGAWCFAVAGYAWLQWKSVSQQERIQTLERVSTLCMAFLLLSLAAGLGGFFPHHFVFAVPGYAALSFVCTANASRKSYAFFPLFVAMLTVGTLLNPPKMDTTIPDSAATLQERGIWRAHVIDSTLEECNVDRYMIVGGLVTQTTHSPLGPFSYYGHMVDRPDSHFAKIAQENLEQASIVIADTTPPRNPLEQSRYDYLTRHFTPTPPSCAMTLSHVGNDQPEFTMFFRE